MRTVDLSLSTSAPRDATLATIEQVEQFPAFSPDVISILRAPGSPLRDWQVRFGNGRISWTERMDSPTSDGRLEFAATDGDFRAFHGSWHVTETPDGSLVRFQASIDLGVPIFDRIVEPLVARLLATIITDVLTGLLPNAALVSSPALGDAAERFVGAYLAAL
jgi:ribosome-associated toxin RatA of RatAB toxin-antitoxin module